jgi:hypothetical protein
MKQIELFNKIAGKFILTGMCSVDDEDFEELNKHRWFLSSYGYAGRMESIKECSGGKRKYIAIHRLVLNDPYSFDIDHIDGDKLNNQKYNLRICTHQENLCNKFKCRNNTSGYKGVSFEKMTNKWVVYVSKNDKTIRIGAFTNKTDAARAYNEAAVKYYGEFAKLNVIEEDNDK